MAGSSHAIFLQQWSCHKKTREDYSYIPLPSAGDTWDDPILVHSIDSQPPPSDDYGSSPLNATRLLETPTPRCCGLTPSAPSSSAVQRQKAIRRCPSWITSTRSTSTPNANYSNPGKARRKR